MIVDFKRMAKIVEKMGKSGIGKMNDMQNVYETTHSLDDEKSRPNDEENAKHDGSKNT